MYLSVMPGFKSVAEERYILFICVNRTWMVWRRRAVKEVSHYQFMQLSIQDAPPLFLSLSIEQTAAGAPEDEEAVQ